LLDLKLSVIPSTFFGSDGPRIAGTPFANIVLLLLNLGMACLVSRNRYEGGESSRH
jgi:hypothetical protein